jgi:NAD(P)-dependent dehydrogenase (short-subunit alcohol dehydrogenase family)
MEQGHDQDDCHHGRLERVRRALSARALADAGHVVYAGMRDIDGHNATQAAEAKQYAAGHDVDLRPVELDVSSQRSVDEAVGTVISEQGSIDVLLHNAGHMVTGPTEAFTPEQIADIYDTNVLGTQRLNRAALPHMRARQHGLVIWIGSTSTRGGTPPYLGPYFAAKAGMDALAVSYAAELSRFDIETTIIVPGSSRKAPTTSPAAATQPTTRLSPNTTPPTRT